MSSHKRSGERRYLRGGSYVGYTSSIPSSASVASKISVPRSFFYNAVARDS